MLKKYFSRIWYSATINTWFNFFSRAFIFVAITPLLLNKLSVEAQHLSLTLHQFLQKDKKQCDDCKKNCDKC